MTPKNYFSLLEDDTLTEPELKTFWKGYREIANIPLISKKGKKYYMADDKQTEKYVNDFYDIIKKRQFKEVPDLGLYIPKEKQKSYFGKKGTQLFNKRLESGKIKNIFQSEQYYLRKHGYRIDKNTGKIKRIQKRKK